MYPEWSLTLLDYGMHFDGKMFKAGINMCNGSLSHLSMWIIHTSLAMNSVYRSQWCKREKLKKYAPATELQLGLHEKVTVDVVECWCPSNPVACVVAYSRIKEEDTYFFCSFPYEIRNPSILCVYTNPFIKDTTNTIVGACVQHSEELSPTLMQRYQSFGKETHTSKPDLSTLFLIPISFSMWHFS